MSTKNPVLVNLYFSSKSSMAFVFSDGSIAPFLNGRFYTKDAKQIEELNKAVSDKNPLIFIKPDQLQIEESGLDPVVALREKIRAELLEEMRVGVAQKNFNEANGNIAPAAITTSANIPTPQTAKVSVGVGVSGVKVSSVSGSN